MLRVRSVMTGVAGTPWYTNHYFSGDPVIADAQAAVDRVEVFWQTIDGLQANEVAGTVEAEVPVVDEVTGDITDVIVTTGGAWQGASPGALLPVVSQGLIQWRTGIFVAGRRLQGRTYIPGLTADNLETNGTPVAATITGFLAAADALATGLPNLVVWSRTHGVSSPVLGVGAPDYFAEMRSRRD